MYFQCKFDSVSLLQYCLLKNKSITVAEKMLIFSMSALPPSSRLIKTYSSTECLYHHSLLNTMVMTTGMITG